MAASQHILKSDAPAPHRPGKLTRLQGVWRSHAYGKLLVIGADSYHLYEETQVSCLFVLTGSLDELGEFYVDVHISPQRQSFSARRATGVTRVRYRRLSKLPNNCGCATKSEHHNGDPLFNFAVFWHTFAERYALFALRGVDWQAAWDTYRPRITADTGSKRLFATLVEMLEPLHDGHVRLFSPHGRFESADFTDLEQRIVSAAERRRGIDPVAVITELRQQLRSTVREHYLTNGSRRSCHGLMEWGQLDPSTGFLAIRAMAGHSGRNDQPREDQHAAAAAMGKVLRDLGQLPRMVVDLRGNGGGYDGVALRLAGFFIDRKRLAFSKSPSKTDGYAGQQVITIEPRGQVRYGGDIILLTSGLTASAAEIFVLALLQHPRLTRIGEATQGILSDVMERHLPNGWTIHLSNELYRAADGMLYEDRGIPPHLEIPFLQRRSIEAGRDPMLDYVLAGSIKQD